MKWIKLVVVLIFLLVCTGCSTRELENRGFPLAIGIDKTEKGMILSFDFPDLSQGKDGKNPSGKPVSLSIEAGAYYEAQKAYENNTNKVLDYNHVKAIILSQSFLEDSSAVRDFFSWFEKEEVLARNTCLFIAEKQAAEILTLTKDTNGSVGKYLEQMVETQEDFKENKIMTIGDLMNQWHNQNELLLLPVLTNNGNIPSVTEYAVVDAFQYKGMISVEDAMKAFLCQGLLKSFLFQLDGGEVVEIQNITAETQIEPEYETTEKNEKPRENETIEKNEKTKENETTKEKGKVVVHIRLKGHAQVKKGGEGSSHRKLQEQLNEQLATSLEEAVIALQENPGIDVSNSFILLGGHNRDLYQLYRKNYEEYRTKLDYTFSVEMNLVNE